MTSRSVPGAELHADGHAAREAEREIEIGGVVRGIRDALRRSARGGAPGGVEPGAADAAERDLLGARMQDAHPWERGQVVRGDRRGDLVGVGRGHLEIDRGHREGVATDAAAEIGDVFHPGTREPSGMQCGDLQPRGLLEPRLGEEHARGELAELGARLRAEPRLAQHRGHEIGRMPLPPQRGDGSHDVGLRVPFGQAVEKTETLRREEFDELGAVHPATLASAGARPARRAPRRLALTLHECQIASRLDLALSL